MNYQKRLGQLRGRMREEKLDAFLVTKDVNMAYLCGFRGGEGCLVVTEEDEALFVDFRYYEEAQEETGIRCILLEQDLVDPVGDYVRGKQVRRLGFEASHLTYKGALRFRKSVRPVSLAGKDRLIEGIRKVKDADEVGRIREACRVVRESVDETLAKIEVGRTTEKETAWWIEEAMRRKGADGASFEIIVASGRKSSMPHAKSARAPVSEGILLIDAGASLDGYCSDLTRTCFLGRMSAQYQKIRGIVMDARDAALEKVRPGARIGDVDRAARERMDAEGYGQHFGHALGHGVGLEVHEDPTVNGRNRDFLEEGMVFTVEPGIYIEGWGGIRHEDVVAVTTDGYDILTE